jgi:hypothetical protein
MEQLTPMVVLQHIQEQRPVTPTYGVTGSRTYSGSYTHFPRHLNLNAIDLIEYRDTQKEKEVWSTMIYSEGSSSDLRRVFPIMVAAAIPYLGENTGKRVLVEMQENSSELKEAFSDL